MSILRPPGLLIPKSLSSYNPITRGCVLYLPLWSKDLSGPVFKSVNAYGHTCTVTGALYGSQGRTFDGDDLIDCGRNTSLDFGVGDFSLLAWIKSTDKTGSRTIMGKGTTGVGGKRYWFYIGVNTGVLIGNSDDNTNSYQINGVTDLADGVCRLVGFTADRDGNGTLYINGAVDGVPTACTSTLSIDDTNKDFTIGVNPTDEASNFWVGSKGEVWAYNRLLSMAEMLYIYNVTKWRYQ